MTRPDLTPPQLSDLLRHFDDWEDQRTRLSDAESSPRLPHPDEWAASDDQAVELLRRFADAARQPLAEVVLHRRDGRVSALGCPHCGGRDVREHDQAVRWNDLRLDDDGRTMVADLGRPGDWERTEPGGFVCAECLAHLAMPEGGPETRDWV